MAARILLATLNARYMHASLGLRYLWANMARHGSEPLQACTSVHEFTIQRPPHEVVDALVAAWGPDGDVVRIVGFGVYIWNVTQTTEVVRLLKARCPDARVVLGGPEVSYEWEAQEVVRLADYLITGWGDVSFPRLCHALVNGPRPLMKVIAGEQPALDALASPYSAYTDEDIAHRVLYVEASRGCPFKCAFCLSALDRTALAFDADHFLADLQALYDRGARRFKFVDRTFNLKVATSVRILQFFLDLLDARPHEPLFLHFEVVPDHLPPALQEVLCRFPPGVLQLEIGIQSFNPVVQQAIARRQDNARTEVNLRWLREHTRAHLHTDLIFGLPGETWDSFAQGFDRLLALAPQEIQLGLLKRLRGTPMTLHPEGNSEGGSRTAFESEPPYAVICTDAVDAKQVVEFARLAQYWDRIANAGRFPRALALLLQGPSSFEAFAACARWLWQYFGQSHSVSPEQWVDALAQYLTAQRGLHAGVVLDALRADYVASGARGHPKALNGTLPPGRGLQRVHSALPARQAQHALTAR